MGPNNKRTCDTLAGTAIFMSSRDHRERFQAEYFQLKIRLEGLKGMLEKWDRGQLGFTPQSPRLVYEMQACSMEAYMKALQLRSYAEGIDISGTDLN